MIELLTSFSQLFSRKNPPRSVEWNKTELAEERAKRKGFFEEKGFFIKEKFYQGRPIIGRDRPINGGVYIGSEGREAVVVDDVKDNQLTAIYQELLLRRVLAEKEGKHFKQGLLQDVWKLVQERIPYDERYTQAVINDLPRVDSKVYLSAFLGGGVCRHQALLAGYLLEKLGKAGLVSGRVSVDRNFVPEKGGHAWVRYENSEGKVIILDPAQQYLGNLETMGGNENRWFYERPEDNYPILKVVQKIKRIFIPR